MFKVLCSAMLGNALEWYDYGLYAQFAGIIATTFFPDTPLSQLLTFAVFAAGFFVRPLGGVVFGYIGDKLGRTAALTVGIITMAIPTAAIGFLPSYETIGIAAPIILTLVRLVQGFSLGGEFSGCIAYIVENAPASSRAFAGSAAFVSMCMGMLLGSVTASFTREIFSPEDLEAWGWRIPFIAGFAIGLVGLYIRSCLKESVVYQSAVESGNLSRTPLRDVLVQYRSILLVSVGIYLTVTVPYYTVTVYMETFLQGLAFRAAEASDVSRWMLMTMIVALPCSAYLSDKIGRKPVMTFGCFAFISLSYPLFWYMTNSLDIGCVRWAACGLAALAGIYMGPVPTVLVESFPTKVRFTGVALSYNLSAAIFGGTLPMVAITLTEMFADQKVVAYYISIFAALSLYSLAFYRETYKKSLQEE